LQKNNDIDFIVINDHITESGTDQNLHYINMNLEEVNTVASRQLNCPIQLDNAWKINELKPLFVDIFRNLLTSYDYWGWCDLDIIWGCLRQFLNEDLLDKFDMITTKENWTTGPFYPF